MTIPLTIAARNEAAALAPCLDSYLAAIAAAEARLGIRIEPLVVLDDTTDDSAVIAASRGVRTIRSTGGKVAAQRAGVRPGPFQLFGDADIVVEPDTLAHLCAAMLDDDQLSVAMPAKHPLPPRRRTPLARALHVYNARRGFSSSRAWFSGKLFAIRAWNVPDDSDIARRASGLPASRFHDHAAPLRIDDIYLSRTATTLRETPGAIWFRAPETWLGMYRYYRRMRRELERIDGLFPELARPPHRQPDLLATATLRDRAAWSLFSVALAGCRLAYRAEQLATDHLGFAPREMWPAIAETKQL